MDGEVYDVTEVPELSKSKQHNIDVVVDRIVIKEGIRSRLFDSIEAALRIAEGYVIIDTMDDSELLFSEHYACPVCGFTVPELEPRLFSFNAPFGSCSECDGLGIKLEVDVDWWFLIPAKLCVRSISTLESYLIQLLSKYARAGHDSLWSGYG